MCITFTNSKSKLNYWNLILREGQFHVIRLIYSDVIVNIKWSLGFVPDIIWCDREVIQYLHKTAYCRQKFSNASENLYNF